MPFCRHFLVQLIHILSHTCQFDSQGLPTPSNPVTFQPSSVLRMVQALRPIILTLSPVQMIRFRRHDFLLLLHPIHSGDWLLALRITSCGLRLEHEALRAAG